MLRLLLIGQPPLLHRHMRLRRCRRGRQRLLTRCCSSPRSGKGWLKRWPKYLRPSRGWRSVGFLPGSDAAKRSGCMGAGLARKLSSLWVGRAGWAAWWCAHLASISRKASSLLSAVCFIPCSSPLCTHLLHAPIGLYWPLSALQGGWCVSPIRSFCCVFSLYFLAVSASRNQLPSLLPCIDPKHQRARGGTRAEIRPVGLAFISTGRTTRRSRRTAGSSCSRT